MGILGAVCLSSAAVYADCALNRQNAVGNEVSAITRHRILFVVWVFEKEGFVV